MHSYELSTAQISRYAQQGFLKLDRLSPQQEILKIRKIYDALFASQAMAEDGNKIDLAGAGSDKELLPQMLRLSKYAPELAQTEFRNRALAISRQLLGPNAELMGDHAILKPAHHGAETPWHQDEAYWDPALEYDAITIWMPLQPATLENGCMQFIPGSHAEVHPHHPIGHDPRNHGLEVDHVDPAEAVACPIPAGGATIHHCRVLHYAGPNRTDQPRRAYALTFRKPPQTRETARDFYWLDPV